MDKKDDVHLHLPHNRKMVYMGHRRFLRRDHPNHRNRKDSNGSVDKRQPPKYGYGNVILKEVSTINFVLGKGDRAVAAPNESFGKKKNLFFGNYLTGHC